MRKRLLILPLALLAGTASVATAQVVNNDHDRGPVAGVVIDHTCGQEQANVVRTQSAVRARRTPINPVAVPELRS